MIAWVFCPLEKAFILICCVMYCTFYDVSGSAAMIPRPGSSHQIISQSSCHSKEIVSPDSSSVSSAANRGPAELFSDMLNAKFIFLLWLVRLGSSVKFTVWLSNKAPLLFCSCWFSSNSPSLKPEAVVFLVCSAFIAACCYIWCSCPTLNTQVPAK